MQSGPLPPRAAGEAGHGLEFWRSEGPSRFPDPCRLVRQVKPVTTYEKEEGHPCVLATVLLHLPHEAAGVGTLHAPISQRPPSPAARGGRGPPSSPKPGTVSKFHRCGFQTPNSKFQDTRVRRPSGERSLPTDRFVF